MKAGSIKSIEKDANPLIMKTEKLGDGDFDKPLSYFDDDDPQQKCYDDLAGEIEFSEDEKEDD